MDEQEKLKIKKEKKKETKMSNKDQEKNKHWATPFKIHTPPVVNLRKVYQGGGGKNFQMHLPSVWF